MLPVLDCDGAPYATANWLTVTAAVHKCCAASAIRRPTPRFLDQVALLIAAVVHRALEDTPHRIQEQEHVALSLLVQQVLPTVLDLCAPSVVCLFQNMESQETRRRRIKVTHSKIEEQNNSTFFPRERVDETMNMWDIIT
ncbi:uncharacterized protein LOC126184292 [Schistocerca cancellata]|uniref:uncharacterized protein LOC126184292 n=1 Tax=Schistocerca cancellata TaxID=274614 RepID=UPI002119765C|nr:uncharacterized protein LOC126184292 [Schistocerca cancellata]